MLKEQRVVLEELSLKAFGRKNHYRKIQRDGLLHRIDGIATRIRLTDEGVKLYLEKTIKVREDFLKAHTALQKKEGDVNEQPAES